MNLPSAIDSLSAALGHAEHIGFEPLKFRAKKWTESREKGEDIYEDRIERPRRDMIEVVAMFLQTWGSTALGFGGIGGSSMTTDYVTVLKETYSGQVCVYFGGCFAYRIARPGEALLADIQNKCLVDVGQHTKYERGSRS